jgi:hypothetical protein
MRSASGEAVWAYIGVVAQRLAIIGACGVAASRQNRVFGARRPRDVIRNER